MRLFRPTGPVRLLRPADAIWPTALLAACAMGQSRAAAQLYAVSFAVHMLSLGSSRGVRVAFGRQTSVKSVRGSVKCALLLQILATSLLLLASRLPIASRAGVAPSLVPAGLCVNIEYTLYEYLYAIGDAYSAAMCQILTGIFTLTGILLDAGTGASVYVLIAASISALVSIIIGVAMGDGASGGLNRGVIGAAPRSMLHSAVYPIAFVALARIHPVGATAAAFFAGLAVYDLCRTPFRRTPSESRPMNRALFSVSAACAAVVLLQRKAAPRAMISSCGAVILASLCATVVFGRTGFFRRGP